MRRAYTGIGRLAQGRPTGGGPGAAAQWGGQWGDQWGDQWGRAGGPSGGLLAPVLGVTEEAACETIIPPAFLITGSHGLPYRAASIAARSSGPGSSALTQTILAALLPVVFVVALGLLAAHWHIVEKSSAPAFAEFIVRFALPIALFGGVLNISPAQIENGPYLIAMVVGLMIPYLIAFAVGRFVLHHDLAESALQGLTSAFPSMAYSGLPVLEAVVGPDGILAVVIGNLVTSLIMIPLTLVLVHLDQGGSKQGSIAAQAGRSIVDSVQQPVVWLPIAGAVLALLGVHLPHVLDLSLDLIGKSAAGVALFTLGLMLYGQRLRIDFDIALNAFLKNIGQPLAMLVLVLLLGIRGAAAQELFLTGAIPTATAASMLALRYRSYADEAAASTLISTVGCVVTITLAIIVAAKLG